MLLVRHGSKRVVLDKIWTTKDLKYSLAERKALSIKMIFEKMPLYIGENELIVGSRTVYGATAETGSKPSCYDYNAMPSYVNQEDINYFGFNHEFVSKAHYTPDYSIVMSMGIDGLLEELNEKNQAYTTKDQVEFGQSVQIVYQGLKSLILRYADEANKLSREEEGQRHIELIEIASICYHIASKPPETLREACQLFWFLYLGTIIENFQFINFGRMDQILINYVKEENDNELTEIIGCLLLKMYDQYDLILADKNLMGHYSAQHNVTIGGVKRDGRDGCNRITKAILSALSYTNLPEPLISIRVSKKSPDWLMGKASNLSVKGLNCMAYYNDEKVIDSLNIAGINIEDARDYGFGLCQDILIPGRGDHYCSGGTNLTKILLKAIESTKMKNISYSNFLDYYQEKIIEDIDEKLKAYNRWENAILEYTKGNRQCYFDNLKEGMLLADEPSLGLSDAQAAKSEKEDVHVELYIQSLMSPLPFTSALYHGCVESGTDITRLGCINKDKGFMILSPVIAINSLAALKKVVFYDKRYTLEEVLKGLKANWDGYELMRQYMWNAPKWCNDDDFVDDDAIAIIAMASNKINTFKTPSGGNHLAGVHQPHPVFAGRHLPATPEGRFAGKPIPVTLSPENGTLKYGPAAAMRSVSKIDSRRIQWNSCLMLQYYSSTFGENGGSAKFTQMLRAFFKMGGIQHQPNVVDIEELKVAQIQPENYKDIIIRMWGVSAHFVDLPKDVQDEFIARFDVL